MSNSNFDKLDSLAENSKDWTLQNDIDLKNILEEYSNNLIKSSEGLNEGIKKLNENMNKIDVRLGNVFNNLNYLKMTRLVEEKVDDISLDALVQKNQRNVNEKKNLTKEEFEQQTIQTISSSIIKAFQKISETNIPITEGFSTSDPLDPCSTSQIKNSDFNKEIENPFAKMCKFPPIIGSKESFNYSRRGVVLKENTPNISTNVEKSSIQKVSLKDEDIQSTSSGRSIPPQDPTAGFNQTKTLLDQMVAKMAEKSRAMGIEQGNSEHSSLSQGLSLEGKTTSPSFSSTSYETSTSSRPPEKIQKPENGHFINEKTSDKSSIHSSKQSTNLIKNPISAKERDEELFSSTESDDYEDNASIFSSNTKNNEQQKVPSNIVNVPKDDQNNTLIQHSLKTKEMEKTLNPLNNQLNSFKQNQQLTLKNILEEYSNNLIKSSEGLNEGIKKLNENMDKIDVRLGNVFNNLNYLKMTRLVEEKVDDISLDTLVQKNQRNVNEKKNLTKEEFEQQTIRTISSSIIKAFQKISETNIPISEGFSTSDPLDPCSTSQIKNSDFNKEIENPFVKMCKFPPIIGSKESFNYSRRGVVLKENTPNISTNVEKSSIQKVILKDEDIQSTSSGRSIPPQDPTAGFNQTKTLLDQMVAKMAEKSRAMRIEQGNSEHSSLSQGLSLEGKTTSPSFSSTSYETSTSSRPAEKIQKPENAHFIQEKTSEKSSIHSSKQSTNFIKNPISAKERDEELFSSTESDDYEDNTSIFSSNTKKSVTSGISSEQQKVPSNIVNIPKDDQNNVLIQHSLKTKEMEKTLNPLNNQLNSFKQNQQLTESKTDEFSSVSVKGLIAQIGNKIPIGRPDEKNTKETNQKEKEEKPAQEENAQIPNEHLNILKGRVKGPASRRAPSHLNVKLQKNNLDENSKLNEEFNKSKENVIKELENKKEGHKTIKETEGLEEEVVKPKEVTKVLKEKTKIIKEKLKEQPKILSENTQQKSNAIFNNPKPAKIKKGLSIFSSSSDDDFDLNINKKIVKEKVVEQPKQFKQKVENIGEIKQQNIEKLKSKPDVTKQRKGLFDDSDSDF
uniref:WASH complex subunit 2 n=1 Tax=Meloidogyne floridensis TaxID=298350 RepID=A0A915NT87_9BILA